MDRSDVVGSLLRPACLKEAREKLEAGALSASAFKAIEDRAVDEAIDMQIRAGLDVITSSVRQRVHLSRAKTKHPSKTTFISAQQSAAYYDAEKSKSAYKNIDAYLADVVDILRGEVEELIRLGCTYIQIDAPQYTALLDLELREGYRKRGNDPDRLLDISIELDNAVIGDHRAIFGLHLCRGNNQSRFYASGDYGPISKIFSKTRFDRFLLEYDDQRSGGFEPLGSVSGERTMVLGLISSKKPQLESKDEIRRRIDEAAKFVPLDHLALSPQCGFASTLEGNSLTPQDEEAKLRLVASVAKEYWT